MMQWSWEAGSEANITLASWWRVSLSYTLTPSGSVRFEL